MTNLCPELGSKGSISYEDVRLETLSTMKDSLLDYMKQDILLLGGIMQKFQDLCLPGRHCKEDNNRLTGSKSLS